MPWQMTIYSLCSSLPAPVCAVAGFRQRPDVQPFSGSSGLVLCRGETGVNLDVAESVTF